MLTIDSVVFDQKQSVKRLDDVEVTALGQSGFRFRMANIIIYIDPYLSDNVEKIEGQDYRRQTPIWKKPEIIEDANWVLITHLHLDHCDIATIVPLSHASPTCCFIGPKNVCDFLLRHGIDESRLIVAPTQWLTLGPSVRIHAVPAAHPKIEFDTAGNWLCTGYVIEYQQKRFYHSGDTSLSTPMIDYVKQFAPIDTAFLPVNEMNYYRNERGIIGNMGLRDAFNFARILGVKKFVPMHWDMFVPNSVHREEIELYYKLTRPEFELVIYPHPI